MDELSAFKGAPRQMRQRETALMKRAAARPHRRPEPLRGQALAARERALPAERGRCASTTTQTRARADAAAMARADALQGAIAEPRLGFFGVIDERLDIDLVAALADAEPDWQIVMVGPVVKIDPASLPQRPNLHWLGQQSYELLPQLVAGWDVCLMPFALNESTRFISPTKTLEYMAAGKPVVSTPIHDVLAMFGDLVAHRRRCAELRRAAVPRGAGARAARRPQALVARRRMAGARRRATPWDRTARRSSPTADRMPAWLDGPSSSSAADAAARADRLRRARRGPQRRRARLTGRR